MTREDPFDLKRFENAQASVFDAVLDELGSGRKRSHWMWFVFPQLRGLGRSPTAEFYGLASLDEARAYLAHPILGDRLRLVTKKLLAVDGASAHDIFGSPDDLKLHSSLTLFDVAGGGKEPVFKEALARFFHGKPDNRTLDLLASAHRL